MRSKITISVLAIFIVGAGGIVFFNGGTAVQETGGQTLGQTSAGLESTNPNAPSAPVTSEPSSGNTGSASSSSASSGPKSYTLAQVAEHNNSSSCWSAINGGVYDLTSWINQHPGGPQAILSICGKDGSAAFNAQHGGQRRPANELAGFSIGVLGS